MHFVLVAMLDLPSSTWLRGCYFVLQQLIELAFDAAEKLAIVDVLLVLGCAYLDAPFKQPSTRVLIQPGKTVAVNNPSSYEKYISLGKRPWPFSESEPIYDALVVSCIGTYTSTFIYKLGCVFSTSAQGFCRF